MVAAVVVAAAVAVVAVAENKVEVSLPVPCWRCQNAGFFEEARVCFLGTLVYCKKMGYIIFHCNGRVL